MKKQVVILSIGLIVLSTMTNAQINVTGSNIHIGNGLYVGTSVVDVNQDLRINRDIIDLTGHLGVTVGKYGIDIGNGTEQGGIVIVRPGQNSTDQQSAYPNPDLFNFGYLRPQMANFIDLGSESLYFRKTYTRDLYYKKLTTFSDARYKENVRNLENATDKITSLRPVSFDFKANPETNDTADLKGKVGFLAQEVQKVIPELVGYMVGSDLYTMDYVSLIPYLVKAFQEEHANNEALREEVEALRESLQSLIQKDEPTKQSKAPKHPTENIENMVNQLEGCRLYQNTPNPFSETTVIRYDLPQNEGNAAICIFDMQGKHILERTLPQGSESGQIEINGYTLQPGMYTYSLLVSGQVADTKKMMVTE